MKRIATFCAGLLLMGSMTGCCLLGYGGGYGSGGNCGYGAAYPSGGGGCGSCGAAVNLLRNCHTPDVWKRHMLPRQTNR